jgi:hypothetical protein
MNNKMFSDKVRIVIRAVPRIDTATAVKSAIKARYMKTRRIINLLAVIIAAAVSPLTWAAPRGGGGGVPGGGHFSSGAHAGAFSGGVSHAMPTFQGGGFRGASAFQGAYFTGRSSGEVSRAPRFYYNAAGIPAMTSTRIRALGNGPNRIANRTFQDRSQPNRKGVLTRQSAGVANSQVATANRRSNRMARMTGRNPPSARQPSTAINRQSFVKNHSSERHDANNWHRDWDRHHAHFYNNRVFVFIDGSWWGLYPWDYYPNYAYGYPYDYGNSYPYDYYSGYPDSYYDPSYSSDYDDQTGYTGSQQPLANATVSAVQSELAQLGYYHGAIDGVEGDETQAALARYQEDHALSVTGTLTAATLQSFESPQRTN